MLEVIANIEDDVYAAEKRKRGSASASETDVGQTKKQQVVFDFGEPLIRPEPHNRICRRIRRQRHSYHLLQKRL